MNGLIKLTLLAMVILVAGCNEKVSPELQEANSSSTVPPIIPPSVYYFGVSNASSILLNYKMHKTGVGNASKACEVRQTAPLSNDIYKNGAHSPPAVADSDSNPDIACYMDVEELALYFSGMEMSVNASANTCEYIGYTPFSWYNRPPGDSTTNLIEVRCGDATVTTAHAIAEATAKGLDITTFSGTATCRINNWVDTTITPTTDRESFSVEEDADLCRFNYTDGNAESCDVGVVHVTTLGVTVDVSTGLTDSTVTTRDIKCGGKHVNCGRGPFQLITTKGMRQTEISSTTRNEAFSKTYSYPAEITTFSDNAEFSDNKKYVNFRRNLASLELNYGTSVGPGAFYIAAFGAPGISTDFNYTLMDRYASNRMMDENELIDTLSTTTIQDDTYDSASHAWNLAGSKKLYKSRPLAAEPFLGMINPDNGRNYQTSPFYSFYCFDAAMDIKARIKIVVRDWDRVFPENGRLEYISDMNMLGAARQDSGPLDEEYENDHGLFGFYNDKGDWDDFLDMNRLPLGSFSTVPATITIWEPSLGFFHPLIFPQKFSDE